MSEHALDDSQARHDGDAGWRSLFVGHVSQPPYVPLVGATIVAGTLAVAAAVAVGATGPLRLLWVFVGASWVTRGQATRWWEWRNGLRSVSWLPAAAVAVVATVAGYVAAVAAFSPHHRAPVIYVGLLVGWFASDAVDWLWRRSATRQVAD